jgi:hypothetical protein
MGFGDVRAHLALRILVYPSGERTVNAQVELPGCVGRVGGAFSSNPSILKDEWTMQLYKVLSCPGVLAFDVEEIMAEGTLPKPGSESSQYVFPVHWRPRSHHHRDHTRSPFFRKTLHFGKNASATAGMLARFS